MRLIVSPSTYSLAFLIVLMDYSSPANAGDWKSRYGVSAREQYSDNICLQDGGNEDEWIATVTPSFSLSGKGGRTELDVKGAFEINNLDDNDTRCSSGSGSSGQNNTDGFNPKLDATGRIELVSDSVFIDLQAQVQQNSSNAFVGGGDSSLNRSGNTNTTYDYTVSPYAVGKIKDLAQVNLRYSYDNQSNSDSDLEDSEQQIVNLVISAVPGGSPLTWSLIGNYQTVDYSSNQSTPNDSEELSSVLFRLGYQFSRKWQVYASTGQDSNDFQSVNSDIDGTRWDAGVTWTPSPRTQLVVGTGDRFIGSTPFFELSHKKKRSLFTASYQKTVTFTRSLRSDDIDIPVTDANGDPLLDFEGLPLLLSFSATTETRSPVVDERLALGYRWSKGRTSLNLDLVESTQIREEDGRSSTFSTTSFGATRSLSPKLTLNTRLVYRETEVASDSSSLGDDSEEYRFYLGARRKLGTKTSMTMNYTHSDRRSDDADDEYRENRLSLGVVMAW